MRELSALLKISNSGTSRGDGEGHGRNISNDGFGSNDSNSDRTVIRTATGKFAKIEILNYYKGI
jgi:hypothetical protein